jgi:hypothetical protein
MWNLRPSIHCNDPVTCDTIYYPNFANGSTPWCTPRQIFLLPIHNRLDIQQCFGDFLQIYLGYKMKHFKPILHHPQLQYSICKPELHINLNKPACRQVTNTIPMAGHMFLGSGISTVLVGIPMSVTPMPSNTPSHCYSTEMMCSHHHYASKIRLAKEQFLNNARYRKFLLPQE